MSLEAQQRLLAWRQNEKNHQHVRVENNAIGMDGTSQGRCGDEEEQEQGVREKDREVGAAKERYRERVRERD